VDSDRTLAAFARHVAAGERTDAEACARDILNRWPENAELLHRAGIGVYSLGSTDLAIACLQAACACDDVPAIYHLNLAVMSRQARRLGDARAAAMAAIVRDSGLATAWQELGVVLYELGNFHESCRSLKRAVELDPTNAAAFSNLGNALGRIGEFDASLDAYRSAVERNPTFAHGHANLAVLLHSLNRHGEAVPYALRAVELEPQSAVAQTNAAMIEGALYGYDAVLGRLEIAFALAPDDAVVLGAHVFTMLKLGRHEEALVYAERAVAKHPHDDKAPMNLANVLQTLNRYDDALRVLETTTTRSSHNGFALVKKAVLLMEIGRRDEAREALDRAMAVEPDLAVAWYNRMELSPADPEALDIAKLENILVTSPRLRTANDRLLGHYALGKAHLAAGDGARAFAHFERGGRLKRSTFAYESASEEQLMASLAATFTREVIAEFADAGDPSETPVFVIGMPRSGTTLVEQILASHPDVHGAGELRHITALMDLRAIDREDLAQRGRRYRELAVPPESAAARVVDKLPGNFLYAGFIHLILPRARIIHVRRDPLDTCVSCFVTLFDDGQAYSYDLTELGRFYRAYETLMAHWRAVLPERTMLEIDYEDIVANPERSARRLIDFCGLSWDERCLRPHETQRPIRTASKMQVRQPIHTGSVGRASLLLPYLEPLRDALAGVPAPGGISPDST
jgi:tetratricopeptide (TPR) repeat protein